TLQTESPATNFRLKAELQTAELRTVVTKVTPAKRSQAGSNISFESEGCLAISNRLVCRRVICRGLQRKPPASGRDNITRETLEKPKLCSSTSALTRCEGRRQERLGSWCLVCCGSSASPASSA